MDADERRDAFGIAMTSDFHIEPVPVEAREQFRAMAGAYWRDLMPNAEVCKSRESILFLKRRLPGRVAIDIPIGCLLGNSRLDLFLLRLKVRLLMYTIFILPRNIVAKGMDQKWRAGCLNTSMRRAFGNWISMCVEIIRMPCLFGRLKGLVSRDIACECTVIQKLVCLIKASCLLILWMDDYLCLTYLLSEPPRPFLLSGLRP